MSVYDEVEYSFFVVYNLPSTFYTLLYGIEPCDRLRKNSNTDSTFSIYGSVSRLHLTALVALFVLATLGFILSCINTSFLIKTAILLFSDNLSQLTNNTIVQASFGKVGLHFEKFSILALILISEHSIIADTVLIHRCYKVWGAKKKIIVLPVFILIINNDTSEDITTEKLITLETYTSKSFLTVNFFTNLVIPFIIAERIWWIGNQVSKFLPSRKFKLTRRTMAICLESGIMYPLALLPALVLTFQPIETLVYRGIAPTFIIVRVALGISIENVQDTIRMNEENGQRDQVVLSMWEADHNIDERV
ncbi:hypothetical protein K435DRAFT_806503 [Dendrothele bispora CBS 962.96]|uniref:Uncharacterized protein n=1 Tax=Dendrothele bispora (strain CBS 962.96) TaxID=1314807 RepID=A0A4S8L824_DENBC|nr:hypothetical protein K435DRAFT_806503 [Dendrothele bispora CBS 962.96]